MGKETVGGRVSVADVVGVATAAVVERASTAAGDGTNITILILPGIQTGDMKPVGGIASVGTVARWPSHLLARNWCYGPAGRDAMPDWTIGGPGSSTKMKVSANQ